MGERLQKSASPTTRWRNRALIKSGILEPHGFSKYATVEGFMPPADLEALISHYWILRWNVPNGVIYRPTEILVEPLVHAFITVNGAFVYGVINGTFDYELKGKGVIAGVAFKPGGFYPFWQKSMTELARGRMPLTKVFPGLTRSWCRQLLVKTSNEIATEVTGLLCSTTFRYNTNHLKLVNSIVAAIYKDGGFVSVESVAENFHINERTLQHLFHTYVGVGAKWMIMRTRLISAVYHAHSDKRPDWARVTADLDYSSQAHFAANFKKIVGTTPGKYVKLLKSQAGLQ